ncbi:tRNA uridine-5-carboxymethylaminomethyl(34) synthesis GTPase MnmE [Maricaulis sp.]|uniref:tRNA uridine-5-carboxymethylaminomethyl(34) synthesis GTPase MnmE n=1 Tax=Maricaulis sp. TaxID=1486257 RepID=UPI000C600CBA|nr:tRNA uridine-5-carboxymethylaminomethyl(34) synthesis GTPase MnmE [Maricaulis sp.]MAC88400.1 tRNA uridine-5-carboxymethylaminomethyl(34) synthesis GTPase MnmE [Maricaulis sp.]
MNTTVYALATPAGRSGVAVIRLSGGGAGGMLDALAGLPRPQPRMATLRALRDSGGSVMDRGLVLWFPGPGSFTGEDSAEFHVHGGPAVIDAVLSALDEAGAHPAEAGEFTRRAFENEKIDLTEAEGLADLIDAETEGQRVQALSQMSGSLRRLYDGWRDALITAMASIEGEIDFPDEADVPDALSHAAYEPLSELIGSMFEHLDDGRRGERIRTGFSIVLIGAPNAGKSSLLNCLARRDAAIVTDIPGTTRDIVEVQLTLGGFPVVISDTAGLREAVDAIEAEGVRRALDRAEHADLRIGVADARSDEELVDLEGRLTDGDLLVLNKLDLGSVSERDGAYRLSAKSGDGVEALEARIEQIVRDRLSAREMPALSRVRHRRAVETALEALSRCRDQLADAPELAGEDARLAVRALESLTGRVDVEDILDRVFSQFCIGK